MDNKLQYIKVAQIDDFSEENRLFVEIDGLPIIIYRIENQYYALEDVCSHDDSPLGEGKLMGFCIICPRHGARFDVRTGEVQSLPATQNVASFPVRIVGNNIEIGIGSSTSV